MHPEPLVAAIEAACTAMDEGAAMTASRDLAGALRRQSVTLSSAHAAAAMTALRNVRYFPAVLLLGDALQESGERDLAVRQAYAQALVDSGVLGAAIPFVQTLIDEATPRSEASSEARGLLGRAYKQLYVNGAGSQETREDYLLRAFNAYYDVYAADGDETWHGVNAAALLHRARRDDVQGFPRIAPFARELYDRISAAESKDAWSLASTGEAALALEDLALAYRWYREFVEHPGADAFKIGSALRQLEEVWGLDPSTPPGAQLLPLLRAKLLHSAGGSINLSSLQAATDRAGPSDESLESIFGSEAARAVTWYRLGLDRCLSVCKIQTVGGRAHGTGFLVDGDVFHSSLAGQRLVLTNHHVISPTHSLAIRDDEAQILFTALEDSAERERTYSAKMIWTDAALDATLLRITPDPSVPLKKYPVASACPRPRFKPQRSARVYVIGHPEGAPLAISLYDNDLLDSDARLLHYLAPTLKGSSGSPVFDEDWQLVGLHHAGYDAARRLNGKEGWYQANEAIWIGAITAATRAASF